MDSELFCILKTRCFWLFRSLRVKFGLFFVRHLFYQLCRIDPAFETNSCGKIKRRSNTVVSVLSFLMPKYRKLSRIRFDKNLFSFIKILSNHTLTLQPSVADCHTKPNFSVFHSSSASVLLSPRFCSRLSFLPPPSYSQEVPAVGHKEQHLPTEAHAALFPWQPQHWALLVQTIKQCQLCTHTHTCRLSLRAYVVG